MLATTTLPSAIDEIGGLNLISWAFALYLLGSIIAASAISLVVASLGLRRSFLLAAFAYAVGCAICALAPSMEILLFARIVQGLGGGSLMALVFISQDRFFPNHFIPRLVACMSVTWSVSAFCGPLIGGAFATAGMWRMAFWLFFGQAIILVIAIHFMMREPIPEKNLETQKLPIIRLMFLALSILSISAAGAYFETGRSAGLIVLGIAFLALFLLRDRRAGSNRMFPLDAINLAHPIGAGIAMAFCLSMSIMSFLVYGPLILINLYGLSPLASGFVVVVESIAWGCAAVIFSGVSFSKEASLIRIGSVLVLAGLILMAIFFPQGPLWWIVICSTVSGSGFGMMWGFVVRRIADASPNDERDRVSSLIPTVQQLGFALGAALSGLLANGLGLSETISDNEFREITFWLFAGFTPLAMIGMGLAWRFTRPRPLLSSG